ncbi:hypothetical protein CDD81_4024 [Ophiocordyceps australis]|uniref:Calpain catalytic domain-containing protein n=1 Tax=Ophiocordyceps australis TaxID=1399860 RepID=A0A2C5YBY2_9HYPO|nr:hypothetical protein CDD81_4024 [Ophiocordyceps australis]
MHGYSSSEESEDPRRPPIQPSTNTDDKKKLRKKRLLPQQSINKNWKRFSNRKFNKALCILPFDPISPASSDRPNELLSDGYDRAVEECKRKVQKIIQECRRVNMRYRDSTWDLDWDLKYQKGHCLNSLGSQQFELSKTALLRSKDSVPKAVKRVTEIFEKPTFMKDINGGDVKQGGLGDCWMMAGLTALANVKDGIQRLCVAYDTKIGIYGFVFFRDGEWIYSIIDDKLFLTSPCWDSPSMQRDLLQQIDREDVDWVYRKTYQTGSTALYFAKCKDDNETWVPLIEKAYAKAHGDYASLSGGYVGEGIQDLCGGVTTELFTADILDTDYFWDNELSQINHEFLFGCSTGLLEFGVGDRNGICEGHAYIIMQAHQLKSGQRLVKLRNPWGKVRKGLWEGPWSDGSKEWTAEIQAELDHKFGSDSVFWISYEDLLRQITHFDRTKLFRDADWRCCQRWIGVDVPWKPEYHEKFHIRLTKSSPLVLVLSQLDGRYFKGLEGQYTFRIHFRLHDRDTPGYIVRSHGNYFMKRSVAVELPDMPAGNYAVYVKVTGERNQGVSSVEEVVKRECKERVENEKLAQVGYAYDLAHSKAWAHMEKVTSLRKKRDQQKASSCRQKERRRLWEKRHVNRDVVRQQKKKDEEKKKSKREERRLERQASAGRQAAKSGESRGKCEEAETRSSASDKEETKASNASDSSGSPQDTPKSEESTICPSAQDKQQVPPVEGPPLEATDQVEGSEGKTDDETNDGDSSDSPVEDWEELYSSDDYTRKPRLTPPAAPPPPNNYDSEEEKMPEPWNAVCIVGIRVYSKDEDLQLRTVMEGGELLEDGMGEKGEADLDNGQVNAVGVPPEEDAYPDNSVTTPCLEG